MRASIHRDNLMRALDGWTGEPKDANWPIDETLIVNWWDDYKKWEGEETVARAFADNRLALKELKQEVMVYGGPTSSINFNAFVKYSTDTKPGEQNLTERFSGHKYDTGVTSYVKRSDPKHFRQGAKQDKYTEGLHDVSMSILKAGIAINAQTYTDLTKIASNGKFVIFVALPEPEDQAVFNRLNDIAKRVQMGCPTFYTRIRSYRAEMTRVKLAWDEDMASNFIALAPENTARPKLRYGMVNAYRVDGKSVQATKEHRDQALLTARPKWEEFRKWPERTRNYKSILAEMTKKYNECTIAIRKHDNPRFPIFTKWNFEKARFDKFQPAGRRNTPDLNVPVPVLPV